MHASPRKMEGSETGFNLLLIKFQADWGSFKIMTLGSVARTKSLWLANIWNSASDIFRFLFWWEYTVMINFIFCRVFWLCLLDPSSPMFVLGLSLKLYMVQLFHLLFLAVAGIDFILCILSLRLCYFNNRILWLCRFAVGELSIGNIWLRIFTCPNFTPQKRALL